MMMKCGQEQYMNHLGLILHENLGEEYPEVLGSILGAMKVMKMLDCVGFSFDI